MNVFRELSRRNVFKVASVYLVTAWLILQVVSVITPYLHLPTMFGTVTTVVLGLGFPFACIFAWAFELTPDGLKFTRDVDENESITHHTNTKLTKALSVALALAIGFIAYDKLVNVDSGPSEEIPIAILPFQDMSQDKSQGYFGDGVAEEILNSLASIDKLMVISRTSSFAFKDTNTDIKEIGTKLGVDYVLEGSIRKDGDNIRITAQLVDVDTGKYLWTESYDRKLNDIFALQDELTYAITQALRLNLIQEDIQKEVGMTSNPDAYDYFVRGRELFYSRTSDGLQEAESQIKKAIEIDPDFHLAKAQLWWVYELSKHIGFSKPNIESEQYQLIVQLMMAPNFPLKRVLYAAELIKQRATSNRVVSELEKAYRAAPNDMFIANAYALRLKVLKGVEAAVDERYRIMTRSPLELINLINMVYDLISLNRLEEARKVADQMQAINKNSTLTVEAMINYLLSNNNGRQLAVDYIDSFTGETNVQHIADSFALYVVAGRYNDAIKLAKDFVANTERREGVISLNLLMLEKAARNGLLSPEDAVLLESIPYTAQERNKIDIYFDLLSGNSESYETWLQDKSLESLCTKHIGYIDNLMCLGFLSAQKHKGNIELVEEHRPMVEQMLNSFCLWDAKSPIPTNTLLCLSVYDLSGSMTVDEMFDIFERSLGYSRTYGLGLEAFMKTSPHFNGVRQHPKFEKVARDYLSSTYKESVIWK